MIACSRVRAREGHGGLYPSRLLGIVEKCRSVTTAYWARTVCLKYKKLNVTVPGYVVKKIQDLYA